uniref:hypothetical protein n=1 Tax=Rhodaphanes brevistipitata TaxID=446136 RepID=UPI001FCE1945|nr:hypothetical protein MW432_pgp157 [Rhodaphanes brevistipitata]UNJ18424.1 hypothetical protein [Rhodaphanes brevistipitata]
MIPEIDNKLQTFLAQINFNTTEINNTQLDLIQSICEYEPLGLNALVEVLSQRQLKNEINCIDGVIYNKLICSGKVEIIDMLNKRFARGIVPLSSAKNIDYFELQQSLSKHDFLLADTLTQQKLCELANIKTKARSWLYFTDIANLPKIDLQTIDNLWRIYSINRFGFSIQKQILDSTQNDWEKLLIKIKWVINNNLCRYPQEFVWDLTAPKGHLPLFNQLRGTQSLKALLGHEAWNN